MTGIIVTTQEELRELVLSACAEAVKLALAAQPTAPAQAEEFLTVKEAAARLKCSEAHVYREMTAGTIPFTRLGRNLLRVHGHELAVGL